MDEIQTPESSLQSEAVEPARTRVDPRTGKVQLMQPKSFWQEHEGRYRQSGQSLRSYCEEQGLAISTFRRWLAMLSGRARRRSGAAPRQAADGPSSCGFLSLPIREPQQLGDPCDRPAAPIEVCTRSGLRLRLDGEAARRLTDALVAELTYVTGAR